MKTGKQKICFVICSDEYNKQRSNRGKENSEPHFSFARASGRYALREKGDSTVGAKFNDDDNQSELLDIEHQSFKRYPTRKKADYDEDEDLMTRQNA